jgi:hypothetical protein
MSKQQRASLVSRDPPGTRGRLLDVPTPNAAVGAGSQIRKFAGIAEIDDMLTRDPK